jgi:hypothetical protein
MRLPGCAYQIPAMSDNVALVISEASKQGLCASGKRQNEIGIFFGVFHSSIFCAGTRRMTHQKDH